MAQKIFKNDESKILFGANGQIIRQPYDLGNKLSQSTSIITGYINLSSVITGSFSVAMWVNGLVAEANRSLFGLFNSASFISANEVVAVAVPTTTNALYITVPDDGIGMQATNTTGSTGKYFMVVTYDDTLNELKMYINSTLAVSSTVNISKNYSTTCYFAHCTVYINNTARGFKNNGLGTTYIWDRGISADEIKYMYNSKIGAEPLSRVGLKAEILYDTFESNGSDPIIKNNVSGYNSMIITGLPAGTLQEKIDYGNANYISPW